MPKRAGKPTYFPGKRGRSKNFFVSKVNASLSLGALAANVAVSGVLLDLAESAWLISADLSWALVNNTAEEGPVEVGLMSSSISPAELVEALDASPTSRGDRIAIERSGRPARQAGQFPGLSSGEVLNNGNVFRTRIKFPTATSQDLEFFGVNRDPSTRTTGGLVKVSGKVYGNWK